MPQNVLVGDLNTPLQISNGSSGGSYGSAFGPEVNLEPLLRRLLEPSSGPLWRNFIRDGSQNYNIPSSLRVLCAHLYAIDIGSSLGFADQGPPGATGPQGIPGAPGESSDEYRLLAIECQLREMAQRRLDQQRMDIGAVGATGPVGDAGVLSRIHELEIRLLEAVTSCNARLHEVERRLQAEGPLLERAERTTGSTEDGTVEWSATWSGVRIDGVPVVGVPVVGGPTQAGRPLSFATLAETSTELTGSVPASGRVESFGSERQSITEVTRGSNSVYIGWRAGSNVVRESLASAARSVAGGDALERVSEFTTSLALSSPNRDAVSNAIITALGNIAQRREESGAEQVRNPEIADGEEV